MAGKKAIRNWRAQDRAIGEAIRRARAARGVGVEELAKRLGVIRQVVWKYESGRTCVPARVLIEIARVLDVSLREMVRDVPRNDTSEEIDTCATVASV